MRATRAWIVTGCLLSPWISASAGVEATGIVAGVASEGDPSFVPAGLESRGQNFVDLPTPAVSVSAVLGTTGAQDEAVTVWGEPDGELVVITQENRTLFAQTSSDGGATFAPAVRFAGIPTEPAITDYRFVATFDTLYVAYLVGDPGGDVGLRFRRSFDMGRTWSEPVVIVARGNLRHGLNALAMSANDAGRVAIMFGEEWEGQDAWVVASSDHGGVWTAPVKLNQLDTGNVVASRVGDIEVSSTGTIHACFTTSRVWYTRSTDGGLTFLPEVNFTALSPGNFSDVPDIATFPNGHVVIAYRNDQSPNDFIDVVRSTNEGASFTLTAHKPYPTSGVRLRVLAATNFPDLIVAWSSGATGVLRASLSQDTGATFTPDVTVASDVDDFGLARTAANQWVLAWSDKQWLSGVFASVSTNGGVTWGAPKRADQGAGVGAESRFGGVTIAGADTVFFAYRDRRGDDGRELSIYAADATPGAFDFTGRERRVDTDAGTSLHITRLANFANDGAGHGYFALSAQTEGPGAQIWVTRTLDGGRTFQAAALISTPDPTWDDDYPIAEATSDGSVYVTWRRWFPALGTYALFFARSTNFGVTWGPPTLLAGGLTNLETHEIAATASAVVVFWSDGQNVRVVRSVDHGATFSLASIVDANPTGTSRLPLACTQGSRILLAFEASTPGFGNRAATRLSTDNGATWGAFTDISGGGGASSVSNMSLACDGGTRAMVVWIDSISGQARTWGNYYGGVFWDVPKEAIVPTGMYSTGVAWVGGTTFVATVGDFNGSTVHAIRATASGITWNWSVPIRVDTGAPQPLAFRYSPHIASDAAGNVWLSWWDLSAGQPSIAVRHSADSGVNWSPVRRADRALPQGANWNYDGYILSAQAGMGIVAWGGRRESSVARDILVNSWSATDLDADGSPDASDCDDEHANVYPGATEACDGIANDCNAPGWPTVPANEADTDGDGLRSCADNCPNASNPSQSDLDGDTVGDACDPDIDGDGAANEVDCAPMDPGIAQGPPEVLPIQINKPTASTFQISWSGVPVATAYDVVRGTVTQLRTSGNTGGAAGQSCSQTGTTYSDTKPIPLGTTWYFMVRGRAGACLGTYGTSSAGVPRTVPPACP